MGALVDEWKYITRGKFIVQILIVPLLAAALFGYIFKNSSVNEAPLAVIDLDHSTYSRQLINKLDSSQYVHVVGVYDNYVEADMLLYNENTRCFIPPAGLEAAYLQGKPMNMGLCLDMTLAASASVFAPGSPGHCCGKRGQGRHASGPGAAQRQPTNHTVMGSVIMFINVVVLALLGFHAISIVRGFAGKDVCRRNYGSRSALFCACSLCVHRLYLDLPDDRSAEANRRPSL